MSSIKAEIEFASTALQWAQTRIGRQTLRAMEITLYLLNGALLEYAQQRQ